VRLPQAPAQTGSRRSAVLRTRLASRDPLTAPPTGAMPVPSGQSPADPGPRPPFTAAAVASVPVLDSEASEKELHRHRSRRGDEADP
jgi:hypothetical protein